MRATDDENGLSYQILGMAVVAADPATSEEESTSLAQQAANLVANLDEDERRRIVVMLDNHHALMEKALRGLQTYAIYQEYKERGVFDLIH